MGVSLIGFFAYSNLNEIIAKLERESKPNVNLLLLNNISIQLREIEYAMERFVYTENQNHIEDFNNRITSSIFTLDTLRFQNSNPEFKKTLDTLENLILNKGTILSQVASLDYESMEETFATLKNQLNELQNKKLLEDTLLRKKRGFIQRLFSKNSDQENINDSVDIYNTEEYKDIINSQLDSIASQSQEKVYAQKLKEFTLQKDHQDIQGRIASLLNRLEKKELNRIRSQTSAASTIASSTNKYVTMFGVAVPLLLVVSMTILYVYISRTKRHQEILDNSRKNALKLAHEKEQFLANMSHEIRTPMNAIGGFTNLLLKSSLTNEQKEYLSIIDKSTEHLTHILNDVLDFSKLQGGKIKLEDKHFNPSDLIQDTVKLLQDKAREKGLTIDIDIRNLPGIVLGDPYRLRQILLNLLYNGIKFTDKGGISVSASVEKTTKGKNFLKFEIMDTGVGIPKDRIKNIFNEFEQVNREDRRKGTGLGLSITKKLVSIHHGRIDVKSTVGMGSTFTVVLPYKISNKTKQDESNDVDSIPNLAGMHVLISDDEEFNRKLLVAICEDNGITYTQAEDGTITYQKLQEEKFDVVLLDFRMPGMNGPEVAEKIRLEDGPNKEVAIIGLTATVSDQDMNKAKSSGIDQVLRKPFNTNELLQIISEAKELNKSKNEMGEIQTNELSFDLSGLSKMGDDAFVIDMVKTFIASTKQNLTEFTKYFESSDWKNCGEVLHKIIAPARHLKAGNLVTLLKEQELSARNGSPISAEAHKTILSQTQFLVASLELHLQETADK